MERLTCRCQLMIIFLFLSLLFYNFAFAKQCPSEERAALLSFKKTLSVRKSPDPFYYCPTTSYPKANTWNESTDCCSWDGVTCDELTHHVIGLDLSCSWLQGTIHSNNSLFLLSHLRSLNLACNEFNDSLISWKFGSFQRLNYLNISWSAFSGRIPPEISHLSKLVSLGLSDFRLTFDAYSFSKMVQNLTELRVLDLSWVDISSVVPHSLLNLSSTLRSLRLRGCYMREKVSTEIFRFTSLEVLDLSGSRIGGTLPKSNWSAPLRFLDLSLSYYFTGEILDSIGNLKSLEYLDLSHNNFSGVIPESSGKLSQLEYLDISFNKFIGQIPKSFGNLTKLVWLNLSFNSFTGSLPSTLGKLSNLTHLVIRSNNFDGKLPIELGKLGKLEILDARYNRISGQIPFSVFNNLTKLNEIYFSYNELEGPLPNRASDLKNLIEMHLDHNSINGQVPTSLFTLPLLHLDLSYNKFTGFVDQLEQPNTTLEFLDLKSNELQNPIPSCVYSLVRLEELYLSSNNLSNIEWNNFQSLKFLSTLDLSNNAGLSLTSDNNLNFTMPNLRWLYLSSCNMSEFPYYLKTLGSLYELDLSRNRIRGIPSLFCNLSSLFVLDLSDNILSGVIPQCLYNSTSTFSVLNLRNNMLHGTIPGGFKEGNSIVNLNFNGNELEGPLPRSLINCKALEILDLGNNKINDTFPSWLQTLPNLQVLVLRSNRFHDINLYPTVTSPFHKLRILDLSNNSFSGPFPGRLLERLDSFRKLNEDGNFGLYMGSGRYMGGRPYNYKNIFVLKVTMKGKEYEFKRILKIFTTINLSNNRFHGKIPRVVGELKSLKVLSFSHNNFTGHIPSSFGSLFELESLDLSHNNLVGQIPPQLTYLTFLSFLNLSYNKLEGVIPQQNQFNTFDNTSYIGNLGLCGFPLTKECSHVNQTPTFHEEEDDDCEGWFNWKFSLMGYGCGLVFGLSMSYIVFTINRPWWFVKKVLKMETYLTEGRRNRRRRITRN